MTTDGQVNPEAYVSGFSSDYPEWRGRACPWDIPPAITEVVRARIAALSADDYEIVGEIAIHRDAEVETRATLKPPVQIMAGAFVAANAYLRGGVIVGPKARIGPGTEIKSSLIGATTTLAHFNFIGDSILGSNVNLEAGAVIANHFNERADKRVYVRSGDTLVDTGTDRFGALIGDNCRIGANAVLSPGTMLPRGSIVGRLELVAPALS